MVRKSVVMVVAVGLSAVALAARGDEFCLLLAENYHEQLYCEITALGQGQNLPSFRDFRRNDDMTQALLLKRPAARLGIRVAVPRRAKPQQTQAAVVRRESPVEPTSKRQRACTLQGDTLSCGAEHFRLVGNQDNRHLVAGVLGPTNAMAIPPMSGAVGKGDGLRDYLATAYRQYLVKMMEIGLGGSTFSFRKFAYLFEDVSARGIDFSERFETMFRFLKQDKQRIAVSETLPDLSRLSVEACERLDSELAVCDGGRKNYLFRRIRSD